MCVRARMSCSLCLLVVWAATLSPVLAVLLLQVSMRAVVVGCPSVATLFAIATRLWNVRCAPLIAPLALLKPRRLGRLAVPACAAGAFMCCAGGAEWCVVVSACTCLVSGPNASCF